MRSIQVNFKVFFLKNHIAQLKKPDFCNGGSKKTVPRSARNFCKKRIRKKDEMKQLSRLPFITLV